MLNTLKSLKATRRQLLTGIAGAALAGAVGVTSASAAEDIKVGAIFDLTGGLNIYGIQQSRAMHVNRPGIAGGLLV